MMLLVPSEKLLQAGVRGGLAEAVSPVQTSVPQVNGRVILILISIWDININTRLQDRESASPGKTPGGGVLRGWEWAGL